MWIGTTIGLSLFDHNNQAFKIQLLPDVQVLDAVQDRFDANIVWLATEHQGLIKLNWTTKQVIHNFYPVVANTNAKKNIVPVLSDLAQIDKDHWLLNSRNKLMIWSAQNGIETVLDNTPVIPSNKRNVYIHSLIPGGKDSFYAAANVGLFLCDVKSRKNYPVLPRNDTLMNSPFDMIGGVYKNGNVWLATPQGLLRYNIATGKSVRYYFDVALPVANKNWLRDVAIDNTDNIVTAGLEGIGILNTKTNRFRFYNDFNTVKYPTCFALHITDSIVNINSDAGLILFNLNTGGSIICTNYNKEANTVLHFGVIDGYTVNVSRNSYTYFRPAALLNNPVPSPPVIEKVVINDSIFYFPAGSTITRLQHYQDAISFFFTSFEYTHPDQIQFRYKIKGLEKAWHLSNGGVRLASYIKLPPGKYSFIVQAGNREDIWNTQTTSFAFEITPPIWDTWWFKTLLLFLFIGTVATITFYRVKKIRKEEAEKTASNKERLELELKTLRSQMNPHFIFNSLNSIQKFIWENKQEDAAEYLSKFSQLMRMTLDNSMQRWITLEQEIKALALYIELEHRRSNNKFDYGLQVNDCLDITTILVPPLILQPYVENAIWHGLLTKEGRGELRVAVTQGIKDNIVYIIEDNGVGRTANGNGTTSSENKRVSYGMQLTHQRIIMSEANGEPGNILVEDLRDDNNRASGTRVTIHLPLNSFIKI